MRKIVYGLLVIIAIALAMLSTLSGPRPEIPESGPEIVLSIEALIPAGTRADTEVMLRVLCGDEIVVMSMERYLIGVVASEMPPTFELDALMAQAVAARTNALYNMRVMTNPKHTGADVCSNFSCCAAYNADESFRKKWKKSYVENITKIINAVLTTDGEYVSYEDEPIQALFHSSSAGKTESSENVWFAHPYLRCVYSPETAENMPDDYITSTPVQRAIFINTVQDKYTDAAFSGNENSWVTIKSYTESGRVDEFTIGGVDVKATVLRSMFNLRSTAITYEWVGRDIVFTTTGFGHGVGMSQYGANIMAQNGWDYKKILRAYYTDVVIVRD